MKVTPLEVSILTEDREVFCCVCVSVCCVPIINDLPSAGIEDIPIQASGCLWAWLSASYMLCSGGEIPAEESNCHQGLRL